ncbi:hypothetical protein BMF94_1410 [Rhodotorula taiwanensis]|uniref:Mediator of RNA polymerase II transcription subunit 19 n=1 Tax=Rhodotorula taiwanensis TaxID=741276 RepID=A0A2S5BFF5_9BASI|nr:hypothetical protein BMF94_1410 [Rhodotorula taiwanensis]
MQPEADAPSAAVAAPWRANLLSLDNPHPSPLSGTRDLISQFHLEPLYDTFLRPYLPSSLSSTAHLGGGGPHTDADQYSVGGASGPGGGGGGPAMTIGGQQSNSTHATTMTTLPPVPGQVVLQPAGGGRSHAQRGGAHVKATPASPTGTSTTAGGGGGLKITLGGIKLAGLNAPALAATGGGSGLAPGDSGTPQKKPRKPKMDKSYEYMVGDVLGRISQPRANTAASALSSSSLLHLVSNPDPAPCPPLHPFDAQQLREAFTLKPGTLAGFDMSIWEARDPNGGVGGPGDERRRKKKKRKHDDPNATDPKKQRR